MAEQNIRPIMDAYNFKENKKVFFVNSAKNTQIYDGENIEDVINNINIDIENKNIKGESISIDDILLQDSVEFVSREYALEEFNKIESRINNIMDMLRNSKK